MKMTNHCIIILSILSALFVKTNAIAQIKQKRLSVIIPCHYKHAQHLYNLIETYEEQTVLPDEVIISLSESHKVDSDIINNVENRNWQFPVKLLRTERQAYAGKNRNIACKEAQGDIFLCQDADDLPHPQRVEIVKHFFQEYDVDLLMHQFIYLGSFVSYDISNVAFTFAKNIEETTYLNGNKNKIPAGEIAISSRVFEYIWWPNIKRTEYEQFNKNFFEKFDTGIVLLVPLVKYRAYLSTSPMIAFRGYLRLRLLLPILLGIFVVFLIFSRYLLYHNRNKKNSK
jgi:glycosyltransferase involved in cell wall biosynthesis